MGLPAGQPLHLRRQRHHRRRAACSPGCRLTAACRRVGFTAYGGAGNDLIIGSQAGDHLAGGSGDDTILGQRGVDHIYGDSGVNVNILTRALTIPTVDPAAPTPTIDDPGDGKFAMAPTTDHRRRRPGRRPRHDLGRDVHRRQPAPGGRTGRRRPSNYGHHLRRPRRDRAERGRPEPAAESLLQKIQTTADRSRSCQINSAELQNGGDDVIFGNPDADMLIGGAGNDMVDGDEARRPDLRRQRRA